MTENPYVRVYETEIKVTFNRNPVNVLDEMRRLHASRAIERMIAIFAKFESATRPYSHNGKCAVSYTLSPEECHALRCLTGVTEKLLKFNEILVEQGEMLLADPSLAEALTTMFIDHQTDILEARNL